MVNVVVKRNARNTVILTNHFVVKFPNDGNLRRLFKEFYLCWKAFLNGVGVPTVLFGPFLIQPRVKRLLKHLPEEEILERAEEIEEAIRKLAEARIEHRELRHPENHVGFWKGKVVFIDFDHGRLSGKSRDLNKFRAWVESLRRALSRAR